MASKTFAEIESGGIVVTLTPAEVQVRFAQTARSNQGPAFVRRYRFQPEPGDSGTVSKTARSDPFFDHSWLLQRDRNFPESDTRRVAREKFWRYVRRFVGLLVFSVLWFYVVQLIVRPLPDPGTMPELAITDSLSVAPDAAPPPVKADYFPQRFVNPAKQNEELPPQF